MAEPHIHASAINAVMIALAVVVVFGSLHLLALDHPNHPLSVAWQGLGF